jgi:hypothetical protein
MKKTLILMAILAEMLRDLNVQYHTFNFGNFKYKIDCFYNKGLFVAIEIKNVNAKLLSNDL